MNRALSRFFYALYLYTTNPHTMKTVTYIIGIVAVTTIAVGVLTTASNVELSATLLIVGATLAILFLLGLAALDERDRKKQNSERNS